MATCSLPRRAAPWSNRTDGRRPADRGPDHADGYATERAGSSRWMSRIAAIVDDCGYWTSAPLMTNRPPVDSSNVVGKECDHGPDVLLTHHAPCNPANHACRTCSARDERRTPASADPTGAAGSSHNTKRRAGRCRWSRPGVPRVASGIAGMPLLTWASADVAFVMSGGWVRIPHRYLGTRLTVAWPSVSTPVRRPLPVRWMSCWRFSRLRVTLTSAMLVDRWGSRSARLRASSLGTRPSG